MLSEAKLTPVDGKPMLARTKIEGSSNIASVGYDPAEQTLHVEFHGGKVAEYDGVAPHMADALMASDSKGQFFHRHIRTNKGYKWRYVS